MHLRKQANKPHLYILDISRSNQSAKGWANLGVSRINFGSFLELHTSSNPTAIYLLPTLESFDNLCEILSDISTQKLMFRDMKLDLSGLLIVLKDCIIELWKLLWPMTVIYFILMSHVPYSEKIKRNEWIFTVLVLCNIIEVTQTSPFSP